MSTVGSMVRQCVGRSRRWYRFAAVANSRVIGLCKTTRSRADECTWILVGRGVPPSELGSRPLCSSERRKPHGSLKNVRLSADLSIFDYAFCIAFDEV